MQRDAPAPTPGQFKARRHHSNDEWNRQKSHIARYYLHNQMSLEETMDKMRLEHGFVAGYASFPTLSDDESDQGIP